MAHEYKLSPSSVNKLAEHPAKAIMAKRWEERRAEARARRLAELNLGDSGIIRLKALAGASDAAVSGSSGSIPAADATPSTAAESSIRALVAGASSAPAAEASAPTLSEAPQPPAAASNAGVAAPELSATQGADSSTAAAPLSSNAAADRGMPAVDAPRVARRKVLAPGQPNWLRDSRKAMLVVALVSHSLLLALLYFGGFLG